MRKIDALLETEWELSKFEPYKINCENCCGLCCVALYFSKMDGFPEDKTAGVPCQNLQQDDRCQIHAELFERGFNGCITYDCFGAGQKVTGKLSKKPNWNSIAKIEADRIFRSYTTVMQLNQILWYLTEAATLRLSEHEKAQIKALLAEGSAMSETSIEMLQTLTLDSFREKANKLLRQISSTIASNLLPGRRQEQHPRNCMGKNMQRKNLMGRDFSMSLLIAANLEDANLYGTNFLGADLRDTNLKNTDLHHSLFLTQLQINAAKGNHHTRLPPYLHRPASWEV